METNEKEKYCLCGEKATNIYQCARCDKKCCDNCSSEEQDNKHYHERDHPLCNVNLFSLSS